MPCTEPLTGISLSRKIELQILIEVIAYSCFPSKSRA
jgi:hypothetical protein